MLSVLRVRTESGSVYDVDVERRRIRRVHGRHGPTDMQPQDGIWRRFDGLEGPEPGQPMVVIWATEAAAGAKETSLGFRTTEVIEVRQIDEPEDQVPEAGDPAGTDGRGDASAATGTVSDDGGR